LLAARYGGPGEGVYQAHPHHMVVNKPRNINDAHLVHDSLPVDLPLSQPTEMSYFLQRIRLAEISRSIVDHGLLASSGPSKSTYYAHVMAMDFELDQLISTVPPFFTLDIYERDPEVNKSSSVFIQAYLLNSLVHTQRCKLHLAHLTSAPNNNPASASSWETCLASARHIVRAETLLLRSQHPFVQIRLRLAAILYSVFVATIVLLMDLCVNRRGSLDKETLHGDVAQALRIVEDAKAFSLAAASLHESLMSILTKYRNQQQRQQQLQAVSQTQTSSFHGSTTEVPASVFSPSSQAELVGRDLNVLAPMSSPLSARHDQYIPSTSNDVPSHLIRGIDDPMYLDGVHWDELFSGIASSSFF
jgi:hypothetical protein